ncbi:MAG: serine hydrolase [Gammaproteobacteria bacterium]|nr:serine hydrolase [Gammaproteobacteria bacterium]MXZ33062.1 serine hydrolase [Gammaproteobacteria bacterium]MYE99382.1 serine hydrolase [Gammaproteobacteria bacterium]
MQTVDPARERFFRQFAAACLALAASCTPATDSNLYFPQGDEHWETVSPGEAGWDAGALEAVLDLAEERNSSALLILHGGRILAERYWEPRDVLQGYVNMRLGEDLQGRPIEDVASIQKNLVAVLVGIARERGVLAIDDAVNEYLDAGWSRASADQERRITVRHLMSMTSGLTSDLEYEAPPGELWRYNTIAYHRIMEALSAATGMDANELTGRWLAGRLGMAHTSWTVRPWSAANMHLGLAVNARDLARFGLLVQAAGAWNGEPVLSDRNFLEFMLSPSQQDNPSYGYLWWLNGGEFSRAVGAGRNRMPGRLIPAAPPDLLLARGALDRKLYVVPSMNLIVVRLGSASGYRFAAFDDEFWGALMQAAP